MLVKTKFRFLFIVLILAAIIFTTCDSPMGMGNPIDFIPPVLTLDPKPPTPMYVGLGTTLGGYVTDNESVERVILRDSVTGEELFTATLLPENKWQIELVFSADQNGQTILADVVAYDRAGNSGAESIASVVLVIDIRPPIVDDIWIQRTNVRTADLLKYATLKQLEKDDPNAEIIRNTDVFQNGAFYVVAKITEDDTFLDSVVLKVFDSRYPDIELLSLTPDRGSSFYTPQWYLTENMLLNAGSANLPLPNYISDYKANTRYYYRLRVVAVDKAKNENGEITGEDREIIEEKDFFCLWNKADFPKGILDPRVVGGGTSLTVVKGSQLPVIFFDDDIIDWAYAALFTKEQWAGNTTGSGSATNYIASGVRLPTGDDNVKFDFIKNRLLNNQPVYNWKYDRKTGATQTEEPLINFIPASGADDRTEFIATGNDPTDYGDYVFISIVKDKKLPPHAAGEYPDVTEYRRYDITLVDENAPLIVFDKTTTHLPVGCPEENTFPVLTSDGKFTIHGYTLREDKGLQSNLTGGVNKVEKFRIAWVPFSLASDPTSNVEVAVKAALKKTTPVDSDFPAGVQWWSLDSDIQNTSNLAQETIGGSSFRKQYFKKTFSILGAPDDTKTSEYDNFTKVKGNRSTFENATKLFIFYAEDNMGHDVVRQFYLLGNKTPPTISIYDITDRVTLSTEPPSIYTYDDKGNINTPGGGNFLTALNTYIQNTAYGLLKPFTTTSMENFITEPYRAYPRGTTVKLWANAKANGDLEIESIKMEDITFQGAPKPIGFYHTVNHDLAYVENFPDVTQRVFLFTVLDKLENKATVQRTIAIASAAALTSITTTEQNGTYPADKVIEIRANFDGLIKLENNTAGKRPKLNVLYQIRDGGTDKYGVQQIECEPVTGSTLFLTFNFRIPQNAQGTLQTIWKGIPNKPTFANHPSVFPAITSQDVYDAIDRPITVDPTCRILDENRGDSAFTPGNVTGFYWDSVKNALQHDATSNTNGKTITLDGIIPTITSIAMVNTKNEYVTNEWYLKTGESVSFRLTASKPLKVSGNPTLRYRLLRAGTTNTYTAYDQTNFEFRKGTNTATTGEVVFTLDVNRTTVPYDGLLQNDITLINGANITDNAGNPINNATFTSALTAFSINNNPTTGTGKRIFFDLTPPVKPVTSVAGANVGTTTAEETTVKNYSGNPYPLLAITNASTADEPYGIARREYSLDGGLTWVTFPNAYSGWTSASSDYNQLNILNGQWSLKTRFIDKAGNEGDTRNQLIYVNSAFPKLLAVNVSEADATYKGGQELNFKLDFDDVVKVPATGVTLRVQDTSVTTNTPGGVNPTYYYDVTATATPSTSTGSRTVTFTWRLTANTCDMLNGLKITDLKINGLTDKFGNPGPAATDITYPSSTSIAINSTPVTYNFSRIIVSTIIPTVRSREPQHAGNRTGNITNFTADPDIPSPTPSTGVVTGSISVDNKTIKLNFSKPMDKGNGTITIRPHAGYAIPAVFDNDEFYTVFNNGTATDKVSLIGSTSMGEPALVPETGLSAGPYLKTTHGLKAGAGFTGNYSNSGNYYAGTTNDPGTNQGRDAPGPRGTDRMVPDLSLKWVLRYNITDIFSTTNATVTGIRTALDNAKWRWQEIPVSSTNVTTNNNSVIITLPQVLPDGLQWDVVYTEGTFQDKAGNKAAALTRGNYWFWTKGVQKPVVRVDRKSYDARPAGNYAGDIVGKAGYNDTNAYNGNIASFNTISYIITSETPQARIFSNTITGADGTGSITGAWTGNTGLGTSTRTWNGTNGAKPAATDQVVGDWVRPNLIFRHGNDNNTGFDGSYNYLKEPGITIARRLGGDNSNGADGNNRYYGFRSYNKDATVTELGTTLSIPDNSGAGYATYVTGNFTNYAALQASKNYVAAIARIDHKTTAANGTNTYNTANYSSDRGYEGVFRTVIAMNQATSTGASGANPITATSFPMLIAGTDARSGLPTVPGFPLKDGVHRNDSRFVKVFYRNNNTFYWVTTEMVTQWYLQLCGNGTGGGSYSKQGDVEDWVSAGYGDLSYALNLATW